MNINENKFVSRGPKKMDVDEHPTLTYDQMASIIHAQKSRLEQQQVQIDELNQLLLNDKKEMITEKTEEQKTAENEEKTTNEEKSENEENEEKIGNVSAFVFSSICKELNLKKSPSQI